MTDAADEITGMAIDSEVAPFPVPDADDIEGWKYIHNSMFDTYKSVLAEVFDTQGYISAKWLAMWRRNGQLATTSLSPINLSKEDAAVVVHRVARATRAFALYFSTETWMLMQTQADASSIDELRKRGQEALEKYGSLEHHPDRIECVTLTMETVLPFVPARLARAQIMRPEGDGKPTLAPWAELRSGVELAGRFMNLLHPRTEASP